MMHILITGGTGHLGAAVVRQLLETGADVTILARPNSDTWRLTDVLPRLNIIHADLDNLEPAHAALAALQPEAVIHLAWQNITADRRDEAEQITVNTTATLRLFEMVRSSCKHWIGVGSLAEYGAYNRPLTEDLPPQPVTAYGTAKYCTGLLLNKLCQINGTRFVWFRMTGTYGPKDSEQHLIPYVILSLLKGEKPALTSGEQRWDYLYVEDAAAAIVKALTNGSASGFYNLGSGVARPVRDIVTMIREQINPALPLGLGEIPIKESPHRITLLQADNTRFIHSVRDWQPETSLENGLRQTVAWYRTLLF
ncbi:MAG: NAD(P)-dependent oxidoreductase [Anaerolineae bacterium]